MESRRNLEDKFLIKKAVLDSKFRKIACESLRLCFPAPHV